MITNHKPKYVELLPGILSIEGLYKTITRNPCKYGMNIKVYKEIHGFLMMQI